MLSGLVKPILLLLAASIVPLTGQNRPRLDTTESTYVLFLDMKEVESAENTELVVNTAAKHRNNPIIPLGDIHEWDSLQGTFWSGTVLFDKEEQIFKAWYKGMDHSIDLSHVKTGYAVSKDGVVWQKPRLGLYEYNGNKDNNIVLPTNDARVIKDLTAKDPQKRYQMLAKKPGSIGNSGPSYYPYYSADGIHWRGGPDVAVYSAKGVEINHLLIDPLERNPARRIKAFGQARFPTKKPGLPDIMRKIIVGWAPDIEHGVLSPANPILDPDDGLEDELHFAEVFTYKSYYVMLYDYQRYVDYYGHGKLGNFTGDIRLAVSRDGERFQRVNAHQAVIARGKRSEWDSGFLVMGRTIPFNNQFHFYYSGASENTSSWPSPNRIVGTGRSMAGYLYPAMMGLATLPLDGLTSVIAKDGVGPGILTTVPIRVKDAARARLRVNVSQLAPYRDFVEVEILDARSGKPIAGYAKNDCDDLNSEAAAARPVTWGSAVQTLGKIAAPEIKLRFYIYGKARLQSFSFPSAQ